LTIFRVVYIWLGFIFLDVFIVKDLDYLITNWSERFVVNLLLSSFALLLLLVLFANLKRWILFIILALPTVIQATYFEVYKKLVSPFGFQTFGEDTAMVLELWVDNINLPKSIFLLILVWYLVLKLENIKFSKKVVIPSTFFLISIYSLIVLSWYSVPNFQNSIISFYGSLLETMKLSAYHKFKIHRPKIPKVERENLPNIIYIVGESFVLNHSSLFGYKRDTTPKLRELEKRGDIVKFQNAVSIGTKTRLSVPYMLVGLEGIDPKGVIYSYPTIINYMKSVGYETHLITSQDLSWGGLKDFLVDKDVDYFVNGTKYNPNARVHKGTDDLVMVEKEIIPVIENSKKPFFMVYQMDGSHYPYSQHSPQEFKKWVEDGENSVNAYDNTLLYSDEVLFRIISKMRELYPNSWILFSTDHGQNLGGKGGMFNDNFELDVIHNAMFISPPKEYVKKLRLKENSPISQADIVATILDILNIKPIKPLDGISILRDIPKDRLRISSTYMPTLHNDPEATLIFPDLRYFYIDFDKMSVTLRDGKSSIKFQDLNRNYREIFEKRLYR